MKAKSFKSIIEKIQTLHFQETFDLVVGICRGGIVPAYLLSSYLNIPLEFLWINFRDDKQKAKFERPILLKRLNFKCKGKKLLLVDDRSFTQKTFFFAQELLKEAQFIKTFVINGKADYSLYNEPCFIMPWDINRYK